jgi:hypothetical protein
MLRLGQIVKPTAVFAVRVSLCSAGDIQNNTVTVIDKPGNDNGKYGFDTISQTA